MHVLKAQASSQSERLPPPLALLVVVRHLAQADRAVPLAVRVPVVERRRVERRAVVPDRDVVLAPPVAHLQVVVLRDVPEEVLQDVRGLVGRELEDARRERAVHEERFVARDWVGADHRAKRGEGRGQWRQEDGKREGRTHWTAVRSSPVLRGEPRRSWIFRPFAFAYCVPEP